MSSAQQLYTRVVAKLHALHPSLHLKRLTVWVWVVVGLSQGQAVQLSEIANHIPGDAQAGGRVARIRRFLASTWIRSRTLYQPIIEQVLQSWANREITLILDGWFIRAKALPIRRVSRSPCSRALPLAWEVVTDKGNGELEVGKPMLAHGAKLVGHLRRLTLLADRGFRSRAGARPCREWDWDAIMRIANNTIRAFPGGVQRPGDQLGVKKGDRRYLLAITWTRAPLSCPAERCGVMTNLRPRGWVLRHYLKHRHSEESFRDEKSGGGDLLALAVAVVWVCSTRRCRSSSGGSDPLSSPWAVAQAR